MIVIEGIMYLAVGILAVIAVMIFILAILKFVEILTNEK